MSINKLRYCYNVTSINLCKLAFNSQMHKFKSNSEYFTVSYIPLTCEDQVYFHQSP